MVINSVGLPSLSGEEVFMYKNKAYQSLELRLCSATNWTETHMNNVDPWPLEPEVLSLCQTPFTTLDIDISFFAKYPEMNAGFNYLDWQDKTKSSTCTPLPPLRCPWAWNFSSAALIKALGCPCHVLDFTAMLSNYLLNLITLSNLVSLFACKSTD